MYPFAQQHPSQLRIPTRWNRLLEIEDRLFTEARLQFFGFGLAASWVIVLGWLIIRGVWITHPDGRLSNIDFCWIWVSGKPRLILP